MCGCDLEGCFDNTCDQPAMDGFDICSSCEDGEHI